MSRTNIDLDEKLVREAMRLTRRKTKKAVVNLALEEMVKRFRRKRILQLEGKAAWTGSLVKMRESRT